MPIIEFDCLKCHHRFEDLILKKEEFRTVKCPKCGGEELEKLVSTFGLGVNRGSESSSMGSACTSCARTSCVGCSQ